MKKLYIPLIIFTLLVVMLIVTLLNNNNLSNKIIKYINNNCDESNKCILNMDEITDFKWDKLLVYQVGSSKTAISEALGVEFNDSVDLMSGIVFMYQNKIVYSERIPYNPDRPSKLLLYVGEIFGEPNNQMFTPKDAIFKGSKSEKDGQFYYEVKPEKFN